MSTIHTMISSFWLDTDLFHPYPSGPLKKHCGNNSEKTSQNTGKAMATIGEKNHFYINTRGQSSIVKACIIVYESCQYVAVGEMANVTPLDKQLPSVTISFVAHTGRRSGNITSSKLAKYQTLQENNNYLYIRRVFVGQ